MFTEILGLSNKMYDCLFATIFYKCLQLPPVGEGLNNHYIILLSSEWEYLVRHHFFNNCPRPLKNCYYM